MENFDIKNLDFKKVEGMMPAIIQHFETGDVLMLGYMNEESLKLSLETKKATFYSRTRNKLWQKGETSGHFLMIKEVFTDCDNDTLLFKCEPIGPTCHTGKESCFFKKII
ncbi:MAG: bifunctional phosphoribosyl-AMP cyclohydrolase/phosphoribosyl-ATP pyrophosphatase protein [Alphaproteobacteria bacterium ADurb.Bin438]|nr:MAG: bifunctional phosphoribosyl-AMP cyclohydrolase/phosphoribosyl-ATP pyrophosphatase protein [Alphaproteobacteria bacterium ADurb.Bin438]